MPIQKNDLKKMIQAQFEDAEIFIEDLAGDGDHYAVTVISKKFEGLSRVKQHQLVYDALGDKMGHELHAMMLKTKSKI